MNTKISYLYRDASNYKEHNEVIVSGEFTSNDLKRISRCLDEGEFFIPRDVGLPENRITPYRTDDDHCWFEMEIWENEDGTYDGGFKLTDDEPTVDLDMQELVRNFENVKTWNETGWMDDYDYKSYDELLGNSGDDRSYVTVNVGFHYNNGGGAEDPVYDETQFDIEVDKMFGTMAMELLQLFYDFCDENGFLNATIDYVEEVF